MPYIVDIYEDIITTGFGYAPWAAFLGK